MVDGGMMPAGLPLGKHHNHTDMQLTMLSAAISNTYKAIQNTVSNYFP